jgi:hypothetical protein
VRERLSRGAAELFGRLYFPSMTLECWYYVAGIVSAGAALVGIPGLYYYAHETTKLRRISQNQLEAMSKPCVVFIEQEVTGQDRPLWIKNVGNGPALNIRWRGANRESWVEEPMLAAGERRLTMLAIKGVIMGGRSVICVYESMSRRGYQTDTGFTENTKDLQLRHTFKEL